MDDLEQQSLQAVDAGRVPPWQVEGEGPSMRSSVRVDDNSHDLSWVPGVTPATLPPPMPLHPRTVLSMRSTATGSWRGTTWSPPNNAVVRHPARLGVEPTIVLYKTLAGQPERGLLPDGLQITIHPAGAWIATTRIELGFARTPRYWLVEVLFAPPPTPGRLPLRTGDSFWLEWRGQERVWQRRPRFHNDIAVLGGFPDIPQAQAPRPPTPPQRRDPTTQQRSSQARPRGFNPQFFVDTRPLRGRLIPPASPSPAQQQQSSSSSTTGSSSTTPTRANPSRPAATGKAKPPEPPTQNSGSETETSWPSEDPQPEQDHGSLMQSPTSTTTTPPLPVEEVEDTIFMQKGRPPHSDEPRRDREPVAPARGSTPQTSDTLDPHMAADGTAWFSVAANFDGDFTVQGLLRLLQKILHEMLQQSFTVPNDYLTSLAYHACYYVSKLQSTNEANLQSTTSTGGCPAPPAAAGPTAMVFCITNSFVEAEAALESLAHHHDELPRRHLTKELQRAEALLRDGRAIFKSWARDPNAPGALPGTAASQNALDGIGWSFLAVEEGGTATLDEVLHDAWLATQRCNKYMDELLAWIEQQFQDSTGRGSPSPKRRRTERPSGSLSNPIFANETPGGDPAPHRRERAEPCAVPVPPHAQPQRDPAAPHQASCGPEPGAAPYNILRAQQILEGVLPFTEQQVASALQEAQAHLLQWTTGLWGEPIVLTDSAESHGHTVKPPYEEDNQGTRAEGVLPPTLPAANSSDDASTVASHRRRRLHAHLGE